MVAASAVSVQLGAALATRLFHRVGPAGAVTLRVAIAALVLGVAVLARAWLRGAPSGRPLPRGAFAFAFAFGLVLAGMNLCFYEAIARIPLGVAVTVEFAGPLAVALFKSRRATDVLWAVLAGAGVALLAGEVGGRLDAVGLVFASAAGAMWAAYILTGRQTARRLSAPTGLAIALGVATVALLPLGAGLEGGRLLEPGALGLGAAVAVLSSALPYTLELTALRRVSARTYGVLASLDPAVAAGAGLALLGQGLTPLEGAALALVVAANLGNALAGWSGTANTTELAG